MTNTKATAQEMELINRLAKRELRAEEVYTFEIMAADTQVDRDMEYFTPKTLEELSGMYIGSTIITDHHPAAGNQTARIYNAFTRQDGSVTRLIVQAYMLREGSEEMIRRIEAGIVKEVSVGCAVKNRVCSVCGKAYDSCRHRKGEIYNGQTCAVALEGAVDAYELSFVAVPAQREAGIIKCQKSFSVDKGQVPAEEELKQQKHTALRLRLEAENNFMKEFDSHENEQEDV